MELSLTAGNLSRLRALAANSKSVQGVLFSARSESSSVEIVKTWLGFPYICEFFSDLPTPPGPYSCTCTGHAAQNIPATQTTRFLVAQEGSMRCRHRRNGGTAWRHGWSETLAQIY
jgi:hypothetical protein